MSNLRLEGKSVVVTGGGNGLGAAYARAAGRAGASVVVNDVDGGAMEQVVGEIRSAGGLATGVCCDISDWNAAESLVSACVETFGKIDGLVNNAGLESVGPAENCSPDVVRRLMEVNLCGTLFCGIHALRAMLSVGQGSVVNVTSGAQSGLRGHSIYSATKGAIASLTYTWAMEMEGRGIRVNAISPMANTESARRSVDLGLTNSASQSETGTSSFSMTEVRLPDPESNAPVVTFLLSEASVPLNGQVVRIDRGKLALMTHPAVLHPPIEREAWTLDAIAEVFSQHLGDRMQPLGVVGLEARTREYSLPYS